MKLGEQVFKEDKLETGWHVGHNGGNGATKTHLFLVRNSRQKQIESVCKQIKYRQISSKCLKKKVGDIDQFVEENKDRLCGLCVGRYKYRK